MLPDNLQKIANQIAAHIRNGDLNVARHMFERTITDIKMPHLMAKEFKETIEKLANIN